MPGCRARVFVAGHSGMVGSALVRRLARENCTVITADRSVDLREQAAVRAWFERERPDVVIVAAARVGGILANQARPAEYLYDNLMIAANLVEAAHRQGAAKLLFLASSAVYPRMAAQPMAEGALLTGPLEPTHEGYAIAKIAGIKLCQFYRRQFGRDFISALPTNLYGPGDNFDPDTSHVLPALIRKAHEAKLAGADSMTIWGTGAPLREFLHVDDLADACIFLLRHYSGADHVNVGFGSDIAIGDVARQVADVIGFKGAIERDSSMPDGAPRKLMDSGRIRAMGWSPRIALVDGIADAYRHFLAVEARRQAGSAA